jgi:hypothetical protein
VAEAPFGAVAIWQFLCRILAACAVAAAPKTLA